MKNHAEFNREKEVKMKNRGRHTLREGLELVDGEDELVSVCFGAFRTFPRHLRYIRSVDG